MKSFNYVVHHAFLTIIFIESLISAVYPVSPKNVPLLFALDVIKLLLYIWFFIYSYYQDWYIGLLTTMFCFFIGLIHLLFTIFFYIKDKKT